MMVSSYIGCSASAYDQKPAYLITDSAANALLPEIYLWSNFDAILAHSGAAHVATIACPATANNTR